MQKEKYTIKNQQYKVPMWKPDQEIYSVMGPHTAGT